MIIDLKAAAKETKKQKDEKKKTLGMALPPTIFIFHINHYNMD
jgi:hypothetical protein